MQLRAATHLLKHKKYIWEAAAQVFTVSVQNILKVFHNVSVIMKTFILCWLLGWGLSLATVASFYKFFNTKIMLNHVVFAKMMVGMCCPSFIFFYDVSSTHLYISCIFRWWWYSSCPVVVIFHTFYSFHWTEIFNELDRQGS